MSSSIHEGMIQTVQTEIDQQLAFFSNGSSSAAFFAQQIKNIRSTKLHLENKSYKCPDLQYKHKYAKYPGVIIEVAYSQGNGRGEKDLPRLAEKYIIESSGNVKLVIGLKIEYIHPGESFTPRFAISAWRPKFRNDGHRRYLEVDEEIISEVSKKRELYCCC